MPLRISLEEDAIKGASQAFDVLEAVKQSLGFRKILSSAPFADPEALLPEVDTAKLFGPPEKFTQLIKPEDL